ncbi:hypothetical protein CHS0354_007302 [Potamilus streckersoni]|uniref:Uncharacterized protein n=1 Tax=Potamilus streckersoni TaxID=2493646 RepID=A0AAE0TD95_9BIVA|nr:hypothetical protein CHS0354_007302 [Potamilus streckersoni]
MCFSCPEMTIILVCNTVSEIQSVIHRGKSIFASDLCPVERPLKGISHVCWIHRRMDCCMRLGYFVTIFSVRRDFKVYREYVCLQSEAFVPKLLKKLRLQGNNAATQL